MRHAELQSGNEVGLERVAQRPGLPPRGVRQFGALEVVADRAGVDAQQLDLARLPLGRRVTGRRLELRVERLRESQADRLLRIGPTLQHLAGRIERAGKGLRNLDGGRVLITDDRRYGVTNARKRAEPGEEAEERGRRAHVEGEPL